MVFAPSTPPSSHTTHSLIHPPVFPSKALGLGLAPSSIMKATPQIKKQCICRPRRALRRRAKDTNTRQRTQTLQSGPALRRSQAINMVAAAIGGQGGGCRSHLEAEPRFLLHLHASVAQGPFHHGSQGAHSRHPPSRNGNMHPTEM